MAIRASINYRLIKASVSHRNLNLTASTKKASAVIYDKKVYASISSSTLNASIFTQSLTAIANFRNLSLHDVHVNAERTLWFFDNTFAFSDLAQLSINKGTTDSLSLASLAPAFTVGLTKSENLNVIDSTRISFTKTASDPFSFDDSLTFGSGKAISDSLGFSESVNTLLTYIRSFTDTSLIIDSANLTVNKPTLDSFAFTDNLTRDTGKGTVDSFGFSQELLTETGKFLPDPVVMVDVFNITRQPYSFTFNDVLGVVTVTGAPNHNFTLADTVPAIQVEKPLQDYFALDDFAQVDKDVSGVKTNVIGFNEILGFGLDKSIPNQYISLTEEQLFALSKASSDSIMVQDSLALSASKSANDSTTLTDASTLSSWIGKSDGISIADSIDYEHVITSALLNQSLLGNIILNAE